MSDPFLGQIILFAGTYVPEGYLTCDGSLVNASDYPDLYKLIGIAYGGSGSQFALPDLQSRVAVGIGQLSGGADYALAAAGGAETVTLNSQQVPRHTHQLMATSSGQQQSPADALPAAVAADYDVYGSGFDPTELSPASVGSSGGSGPHANIQPYIGLRYLIACQGVSPSAS